MKGPRRLGLARVVFPLLGLLFPWWAGAAVSVSTFNYSDSVLGAGANNITAGNLALVSSGVVSLPLSASGLVKPHCYGTLEILFKKVSQEVLNSTAGTSTFQPISPFVAFEWDNVAVTSSGAVVFNVTGISQVVNYMSAHWSESSSSFYGGVFEVYIWNASVTNDVPVDLGISFTLDGSAIGSSATISTPPPGQGLYDPSTWTGFAKGTVGGAGGSSGGITASDLNNQNVNQGGFWTGLFVPSSAGINHFTNEVQGNTGPSGILSAISSQFSSTSTFKGYVQVTGNPGGGVDSAYLPVWTPYATLHVELAPYWAIIGFAREVMAALLWVMVVGIIVRDFVRAV